MSTQINQQEVVFDNNVVTLIQQLKRVKADLAALQEQADILTEQIKFSMGEATIGTIDGRPVVRWTVVETTRFDTKKAREILPDDLVTALTTHSIQRRFTIVDED